MALGLGLLNILTSEGLVIGLSDPERGPGWGPSALTAFSSPLPSPPVPSGPPGATRLPQLQS